MKRAESSLKVVARSNNGLRRTYRLAVTQAQNAAYRRLAVTILGLDVASLAETLRLQRSLAKAA